MKRELYYLLASRIEILAVLLLIPSLAQAHPNGGAAVGFVSGVAHPLTGLDHLLAMIGVGIFAVQRGGRAIWMVPLAFISVMTLGAILGAAGLAMPFAEKGIVASVLVLGVLIAAAVRLPLVASTILVGVFALFHGHTHGAEMPATALGWLYGLGFLLTTAGLHLSGIGLGLAARKINSEKMIRYAGGAMALCGIYLAFTI